MTSNKFEHWMAYAHRFTILGVVLAFSITLLVVTAIHGAFFGYAVFGVLGLWLIITIFWFLSVGPPVAPIEHDHGSHTEDEEYEHTKEEFETRVEDSYS